MLTRGHCVGDRRVEEDAGAHLRLLSHVHRLLFLFKLR
jgi:hypothetical protein